MSKYYFPDDLNKAFKDISNKVDSLRLISKKIEFPDDGIYTSILSREYKKCQSDLNSKVSVTSNPKIMELLTEYSNIDLNDAKSLDTSKISNCNLKNFSLSKIIMRNHIDRITLLSSVSNTKRDIENKRKILAKLKNEHLNTEIDPSIGLKGKLTYFQHEFDTIETDTITVQKESREIMKSAQLLKKLMNLFDERQKHFDDLKNLANADSEIISKLTTKCHKKIVDINHHMSAVQSLLPSIQQMFVNCFAYVKTIGTKADEKLSFEDIHLNYFESAHNKSKMYNIVLCLLEDYKSHCELSGIVNEVKKASDNYKGNGDAIRGYCGKFRKYEPVLNDQILKEMVDLPNVEVEIKNLFSRFENVLLEWSILRDSVK